MKKLIFLFILIVGVAALILGNCGRSKAEVFCLGNPPNLTAVDLEGKVFLSWDNYCFPNTLIRYSYEKYPINPVDGAYLYEGKDKYYEMVPTKKTVYFCAYGYVSVEGITTYSRPAQVKITLTKLVTIPLPTVDGPTAKSLVVPSSDIFLGAAGVAGGPGGGFPIWTMWALGFILLGCIGLYVFLSRQKEEEK